MSEKDQQETLLMAIEYLKAQYESLQTPCIALLISRYYRLLANLNMTKNKREKYVRHSRTWLSCHINNPRHSQKMQNQLTTFIQPHELN
jgi:tRNA G26 N,N-dimethylase Trm1